MTGSVAFAFRDRCYLSLPHGRGSVGYPKVNKDILRRRLSMSKNCHKPNRGAEKKNLFALCGCLMFLVVVANFCSVSIYAEQAPAEQTTAQSKAPEIHIDADSIVQLVFGRSPEVVSSRHALRAAEFQFKDFERNLSQFTPIVFRSNINRDDRNPYEEHAYSVRTGMEKEFFDGSRIFGGVGHRGGFGDTEDGRGQFVEMDVEFPLFGSNTTLRRITDRSREENEMLNARLEYVDVIRDIIQEAQEEYFRILVSKERRAKAIECISDFEEILGTDRAQSNPAEREQLEGELRAERTEILRTEEHINRRLLGLQLSIGLENLALSQVNSLDMYAEDHYGKSYLERSIEDLLAEAERNDVKIRVLENARANSIEKKQLADEGKWDVFVGLNGQYDLEGEGNLKDENGYLASVGLSIKKIDSTLLSYSRGRAVAEIKKYEAMIRGQRLKTQNVINLHWFITHSRRKQCEEVVENIDSRRKTFLQKRQAYIDGKETLDNLITARDKLMWTEMELAFSLGEFYESVTELDHACGVYFGQLGIKL